MITRLATRGPRFFVGVSAVSVLVAASVMGVITYVGGQSAEVLGGAIARPGLVPPEVAGRSFGISGSADGELSPGVERWINLRFTNPNNFAIVVDSVNLAASDNYAACGAANLQVTRQFSGPVTVPANGASAMSATSSSGQRPSVAMINLDSNQDSCKGATFTFTYTGSASRA